MVEVKPLTSPQKEPGPGPVGLLTDWTGCPLAAIFLTIKCG